MGDHPELIFQSIGIIVSIAAFNACGVSITKYASAAQRSTVDTCRTLIIWVVSMLLGWESFLALELVGFFMLVGGTLVYNEIIILPCEILNKDTKAIRNAREGKLDGMGNDANYMATSPQAAYDSNRNKRNLNAKMNERHELLHGHKDGDMYINEVVTNSTTRGSGYN